MKLDFANKHLVITGGTGALGSAVTHRLLEAGAKCSIPCFDKSELKKFDLEGHERLYVKLGVDLTDEEETQDFYSEAVEQHGLLRGSVHIAGGFGMSKIENTGKNDFMKQINLNLVTCFNSCKTAVSHMRKSGGRIVNIASRPGLEPRQGAGMIPYTVSKSGIASLTESLAAELVENDILVNAVAPSTIDTPANRESMPDADYEKWPKPEEIANQILYLISDLNTITRGAVVPVYGES
jgi:NAD(P)-dependent dehydrogenase (short-subunit alcohol dehydrogenase family)